jgi:hypothetical protein
MIATETKRREADESTEPLPTTELEAMFDDLDERFAQAEIRRAEIESEKERLRSWFLTVVD